MQSAYLQQDICMGSFWIASTMSRLFCSWKAVRNQSFPIFDTHCLPSYSILPAISLDGVVHLDILTSSWNGEQFCSFMDTLLTKMQPFPLPNSVVVMDNATVHHFDGLREMVEAQYVIIIVITGLLIIDTQCHCVSIIADNQWLSARVPASLLTRLEPY